jgi:uncharacterized protein
MQGQTNLGFCYVNGVGVTRNKLDAYVWFLLAAAQGHEQAQENLDNLEPHLSTSERNKGQRLAGNWQPSSN